MPLFPAWTLPKETSLDCGWLGQQQDEQSCPFFVNLPLWRAPSQCLYTVERVKTFLLSLNSLSVSSVQFSSVIRWCLTLQPHELQHARAPCPSPTPGVYSNSCPWTWWCHPITSSSVVPFSSWIHRLFTNPRNKVQLFPPFPSRWRCEIEWYGSAMSCLSAPQTQLQPEQVPTHMILALNNISVEILESLLKV